MFSRRVANVAAYTSAGYVAIGVLWYEYFVSERGSLYLKAAFVGVMIGFLFGIGLIVRRTRQWNRITSAALFLLSPVAGMLILLAFSRPAARGYFIGGAISFCFAAALAELQRNSLPDTGEE